MSCLCSLVRGFPVFLRVYARCARIVVTLDEDSEVDGVPVLVDFVVEGSLRDEVWRVVALVRHVEAVRVGLAVQLVLFVVLEPCSRNCAGTLLVAHVHGVGFVAVAVGCVHGGAVGEGGVRVVR